MLVLSILSAVVGIFGILLLVSIKLLTSDFLPEDKKDELFDYLEIPRRHRISLELQEDYVISQIMMLCFPYINVFVLLTWAFAYYCRRK